MFVYTDRTHWLPQMSGNVHEELRGVATLSVSRSGD